MENKETNLKWMWWDTDKRGGRGDIEIEMRVEAILNPDMDWTIEYYLEQNIR
jgi:hypothetical protein